MKRWAQWPSALGLFAVVFVVTHLVNFPGSVAFFREVTGGQALLDMRPSFSPAAVHQRLEAMGPAGRAAYLQLIAVVDLLFPLVMLNFLRAWTRRWSPASKVLRSAPFITFGADMIENALIAVLLLAWPAELTAIAASIAPFTVLKRTGMLVAMFAPPLVRRVARGARTLNAYRGTH